jgi:hypothetical protein
MIQMNMGGSLPPLPGIRGAIVSRQDGLVGDGYRAWFPGQLNTASFGGRQLAPTSIERQSLFSP